MAVETLADVLPGVRSIDAFGELNEDGLPILRIERVNAADGRVLYDVSGDNESRAVEDAVDRVNTEFLDRLIDLTGDEYMGEVVIA